jgi:hypothetical protein
MSARSRMTQRALVERYTGGAIDDSGNPGPGGTWATHLAAMPCWLYGTTEREAVTEATTAVVTDLKLLAPLSADLTEKDRINQVKDRRGTVIEAGLLGIETILRKRSHLELALSRVSG